MLAAAVCSYLLVKSGDSCASLASRCGISAADFTKHNPSPTLCSTLAVGEPKHPDGTCVSYTVKKGDDCALIARNNHITAHDIETYNAHTWGWNGCSHLQLGANICLSTGDPPMPAAVPGAVCGPQVAGTKRPGKWSDIGSLNPCPLNACCNIWGQCGITPDFCTPAKSSTGAPGTSPPGINGCISNCGTSIINSHEAPTEFRSIGYFEAFGANRSCLAMHASQIPGSYSHVHYAFGSITSDFEVDLSQHFDQFEVFANSTGSFANPGCPSGNCLRSHVNLTETEYALSMITKAGVPTNKIAVGIAGYGRSFGMADPSCTGPHCQFTGPNSTATPGECTAEAGYISQAELEALGGSGLERRAGVKTWHDASSDSDIMTYGNGTWVAYMSQKTKASRINKYAALNFGGSVEWAIDLVQAVESPEDVENSLDVAALEETFTAALELSEYDISEFEHYNLTILATALKGWDGCKRKYGFDPRQITSGWQQSWRIMNNINREAKAGINWNEASAIEYLGPPAMNHDSQAGITKMYKNLATIQPGWLVPSFLSWGIAVRCDDPGGLCPCGSGSDTIAYTNNKDPKYGIASINFCPRYFTLPRLGTVMRQANTNHHPAIWANVSNYSRNQGSVWIHELLHIDWVTYATSKTSKITLDVYGPLLAKGLARFKPFVDGIGTYTNRNADNLSMYALARYIQRALKNVYPHLPLAPRPPETVDPLYELSGYVTLHNNGTVELPADRTLVDEAQWSLTQGVCAKGGDMEDGVGPDAFASITHTAQVLQPSDFPADYLSSWSSWAGLTPTTTSASPTPTATWTIAIYSEPDCAGDYYSLEGYNLDSPDDECLVLRGGGIPTTSKTGTTCRWFTNGGFDWHDCSTSTLTQPLSWSVLGGVCTAYDTDTCTDDGNADAYDPAQGCHNYSASNLDTKTWISLQCGAQPGIGNGEPGRRPLQMVQSGDGKGPKGNHTSVVTKAIDPALHKTYRFHPKPTTTGHP
ncbi:glycoside hydrolase family 18 protein [Trichoderma aethiopicum]